MDNPPIELAAHLANEEKLKEVARGSRPKRTRLIIFIKEKYENIPFSRNELFNEFSKKCKINKEVLRNYLVEFVAKGYLRINKVGPKRWLYETTPDLLKLASEAKEELETVAYLHEIPQGAFRLRGCVFPSKKCAHLFVWNRALSDSAKRNEIRCRVYRFGRAFIVRRSQSSSKAYARDYTIELSLHKYRVLYADELYTISNGKIVPAPVYVVPEEWGIQKWDLFTESNEARELARALSKYFDVNHLPTRNYRICRWRFDIALDDLAIEITTGKPDKGGPHRVHASMVRSKILDLLLYALEESKKSVAVIPLAWAEKQHMRDLKQLQKYGCYIIFVDFDNNKWSEKVAQRIKELIQR